MRLAFWLSVAAVAYVYFGYPLFLRLAASLRRGTTRDEGFLPTVSLVIAAFNEERVIRQKIENALALDYPADRLEIVVASDGSTDRTNEIARMYADRGVVLRVVLPRGGKTRAINTVVPGTRGDILVLSDANTMYRPDALRRLVRHFADPRVGAVSGDVRLVDSCDDYAASEGLYYKYERWLQLTESRVQSIIGADGGMYALRRSLFVPPSPSIVVDDFVISMNVACLGYRVLYDPEAIALENGTLSSAEEFRRKIRVVAGAIQALRRGEGVPGWSQPMLLWCYLSHKLLRWMVPCFMVVAFAASALLAASPLFRLFFAAQAAFYIVAAGYAFDVARLRRVGVCAVPYYFCLVNGAALAGLWKGVRSGQSATWNRTTR
jgi:cellulose synthase/poly-beta-1,6-N-acetylglucosamine synthase-like glycosyltransferase